MSHPSDQKFHDEAAATGSVEAILWPEGPICPRCGGKKRITRVVGKTARPGLRRCGPCKRQFTVTVGTVFELSHVPMHKWLQAVYLRSSSKKVFLVMSLCRPCGGNLPNRLVHERSYPGSYGDWRIFSHWRDRANCRSG